MNVKQNLLRFQDSSFKKKCANEQIVHIKKTIFFGKYDTSNKPECRMNYSNF